jgi:hypothetical protein
MNRRTSCRAHSRNPLPRFTARATRTHRPAALAGLIGQLYAERHFPAAQKARVNLIVRNVSAAFRRRVESVSWLSPASRKAALAKIDVVYFGVGYPERWPNYSSLVVNAADPIGNRMRLAEWNFRETVSRVGQPVDPAAWWITPQTPGAVLLFNQNAYNFAAALLQAPKYDANASDAVNYGAIGAIVGHELSHFVDTLGADYDAAGAKVRWWTPQDMAGYEAATAPLVRQYSNYSIPSGEHLDGKLALVENVADLAGLCAAFDAYRLTLGDRPRKGIRPPAGPRVLHRLRARLAQPIRDDALRSRRPLTTCRNAFASPRSAISTPGTRPSTCRPDRSCTSSRGRGSGSGSAMNIAICQLPDALTHDSLPWARFVRRIERMQPDVILLNEMPFGRGPRAPTPSTNTSLPRASRRTRWRCFPCANCPAP